MPANASDRPTPPCPQCGQGTRRIRRHNQDRATPELMRSRRYRCRSADCGWEGLLTRPDYAEDSLTPSEFEPPPPPEPPNPWRTVLIALAVLAAIGLPIAVAVIVGLGSVAGIAGTQRVAAGTSHDGLPLRGRGGAKPGPRGGTLLRAQAQVAAPADAQTSPDTDTSPLALRHGCAWGQPGRNPYRGTVAQALNAARLPADVVRQIVAAKAGGQKTGRLEIRSDSIREQGGARQYSPRGLALSFGHTLCLNSRVNFAPGHVELADLYEARDAQGRLYAVMVPDVCGNVSVLASPHRRGLMAAAAAALAQQSVAMTAVADALADGGSTEAAETGDAAGGGEDALVGEGGAAGAQGAVTGPRDPATSTDGDGLRAPTGVVGGSGASSRSGRLGTVAGTSSGTTPEATVGGTSATGAAMPSGTGVGTATADTSGSAAATGGAITRPTRGLVASTLGGTADLLLPRSAAVSGLKTLAEGLAVASEAAEAAAGVLGGAGAPQAVSGLPSPAERNNVPEPGTLLCVLVAIGALVMVRRG